MLIDANLLLFAVDSSAPMHKRASAWLTHQLNGERQVLGAFVRIATHPRSSARALTGPQAWKFVEEWLAVPVVWVPGPTERHSGILGGLIQTHQLTGNLIPDAHLAAIAIQHGLEICSADTDFARFPEIRWRNPLTPDTTEA